jgi:hypothetical protein
LIIKLNQFQEDEEEKVDENDAVIPPIIRNDAIIDSIHVDN